LDFWQPAIDSHNLNHNLNDEVSNILDFWSEDSLNIDKIDNIEDSEIIIGSPSCVSFSTSNKWGKADKSM
jgi:DNA (cytosine-5)-methyltransferase 1